MISVRFSIKVESLTWQFIETGTEYTSLILGLQKDPIILYLQYFTPSLMSIGWCTPGEKVAPPIQKLVFVRSSQCNCWQRGHGHASAVINPRLWGADRTLAKIHWVLYSHLLIFHTVLCFKETSKSPWESYLF